MGATETSNSQLVISISAILIAVILVCALPYHVDAQTLHSKTLEAIVKQKVFHGNSQVDVGFKPGRIDVDWLEKTIYVVSSSSSSSSSGSGTVSVISISNNTKVKDIQVGKFPSHIAFDYMTDTIYVTNFGSGTVSAINGTTHRVENIMVGEKPRYIAIDYDSGTVYVSNFGSNGISVIDDISKKVVAGVIFNINPANSGHIVCNKISTPINQLFYLSSGTTCTAVPNTGFEFSSWVEKLKNNASRTISTYSVSNSFLNPVLNIFGIKQNDSGAILNVTKFGSFTGNFRDLPPANTT